MKDTDWSAERALLEASGASLTQGLTDAEMAAAEEVHGFTFPDDLRSMLAAFLPIGGRFPNWRLPESEDVVRAMDWPFEGIAFDIEKNHFWWPSWEPRPGDLAEAFAVAKARVSEAPRLIPITGHRYLPASPTSAGNPVFSVHQTDIIYYGRDLRSFMGGQFGDLTWEDSVAGELRPIEFWTDVTERD